jgi:hypothetical protein
MLLELHKDDLMAAKELWYERLGIEEKSSSRIHTQAAVAASNSSVHKNDKASDDEIIFIGLVKALEPIAARIVESATPEDRKRLREKVGSKEFFGLSTNFNRLCSEVCWSHPRRAFPQALSNGDDCATNTDSSNRPTIIGYGISPRTGVGQSGFNLSASFRRRCSNGAGSEFNRFRCQKHLGDYQLG